MTTYEIRTALPTMALPGIALQGETLNPLDTSEKSATQPLFFDQPQLPEQQLQDLLQVQELHALKGLKRSDHSLGVSLYTLHPYEIENPWILNLYDISKPFTQNDQDFANMVFITEGTATISFDNEEKMLLPGHSVRIVPEAAYTLTPGDHGCRFLCLSMPKSIPSENICTNNSRDIFVNQTVYEPVAGQAQLQQMTKLPETCFQEKVVNGPNTVYDLILGATVNERYNISIMDFVHAGKHYHKKETGLRFVLGGTLVATLNGNRYNLDLGQSCRVSPLVVHQFESMHSPKPTRVLAINIPAYKDEDRYSVD